MSNLTKLQAISTSLDIAINTAESLPEAGSGGNNVEVCMVHLRPAMLDDQGTRFVSYTTIDNSGNLVAAVLEDFNFSSVITCVCNTPIVIHRGYKFTSDSIMSDFSLITCKQGTGYSTFVFNADVEANTENNITFILF